MIGRKALGFGMKNFGCFHSSKGACVVAQLTTCVSGRFVLAVDVKTPSFNISHFNLQLNIFPSIFNFKTGPNCTTERFEGTWSFFKLMAVNSRLPFSSAALIRSLFLPFVHPLLLAHPFLVVLMMTDLGVGQATCKVIMGK